MLFTVDWVSVSTLFATRIAVEFTADADTSAPESVAVDWGMCVDAECLSAGIDDQPGIDE
ncbi:hypothetical protein C7E18_18985 [Stenotrophomonas maltophilia]|nr:hypothetical protein C7E18_18985 [Stenotrophomonas maltophilia]